MISKAKKVAVFTENETSRMAATGTAQRLPILNK
jgi:hypothetical protein